MVGGKTILVVDDESSIAMVIRLLLDDLGVAVLSAPDGDTALGMIRERRPDLVISDVMMPGLDGRELCRIIRSDPELASIRLVLMSAVHKLDLRDCEADGFLPKPFGLEMLEGMVERFLADVV